MPPQKKVSKSTATEHASGNATEHVTSGNATEHAIARWQALSWRSSKDCQHVIQVLLTLRAKATHQHLRVQRTLVQKSPPFFIPSREDTFFAVLQQEIITDMNLRDSIVDFLARWEAQHEASYRELLADSAVTREANVLLPKDLPMWRWIRSRLHGEMELIEEGTDCWTVHLIDKAESLLLKQVGRRYKAIA